MAKNMDFGLTTEQVVNETKTVTRRDNWLDVKAGDMLRPVDRVTGFSKGEKPVPLLRSGRGIVVISVSREPLNAITPRDVVREGFPEMTPAEFVEMYVRANGGPSNKTITRITYAYVDDEVFQYAAAESVAVPARRGFQTRILGRDGDEQYGGSGAAKLFGWHERCRRLAAVD